MYTAALFGPPGTGKTTEMLRRVEDARSRGYNPHEIGFFAFTRNAANEALKRLNLQRSNVISTLHSLAFRRTGAISPAMVDGYKLRKFGEKIGVPISASKSDEYGDQMEIGDQMLAVYELSRARLRSPEDEYQDSDRPGSLEEYNFFIESYKNWKKAYGYTDFTDLLEQYIARPEVHDHGAAVLFIDEAQDLSPLQWKMVKCMVAVPRVEEATIAGDDDQAIFEWAGADPHGMARWTNENGAEQLTLKQSYRVPQSVHDLARTVVVKIRNRVQKVYRPDPRPGEVVRHTGFESRIVTHGDDALILVRSQAQRKEVEETLIADRVPYKIDSGKPGLYDSKWAVATRALLHFQNGGLFNSSDAESIVAVGTSAAKRLINDRDFKGLAKLRPEQAITYPIKLIEFFRNADLTAKPTIRISTIHAAKGGEARKVVIHTGITQRTQNGLLDNPDAEHRVWYVGVTRAKEELHIVSPIADASYDL